MFALSRKINKASVKHPMPCFALNDVVTIFCAHRLESDELAVDYKS